MFVIVRNQINNFCPGMRYDPIDKFTLAVQSMLDVVNGMRYVVCRVGESELCAMYARDAGIHALHADVSFCM